VQTKREFLFALAGCWKTQIPTTKSQGHEEMLIKNKAIRAFFWILVSWCLGVFVVRSFFRSLLGAAQRAWLRALLTPRPRHSLVKWALGELFGVRVHRNRGILPTFLTLFALLAVSCMSQSLGPESARSELNRRGIEYSAKSFVASAAAGQEDVVGKFLEAGMDIDVRSDSGETALMGASGVCNAAIVVDLLEKGARVDLKDDEGRTALHWAARATDGADCVRHLLRHGADPNAKTGRGNTPLIESIDLPPADSPAESWFLSKYVERVRILLENGADVNASNQDGVTPLMRAAVFGNTIVVRLLIEREANVKAVDKRGRNARMYAHEYGNTEAERIVELAGRSR
jgi:Ankyrin repeats (3 copies)